MGRVELNHAYQAGLYDPGIRHDAVVSTTSRTICPDSSVSMMDSAGVNRRNNRRYSGNLCAEIIVHLAEVVVGLRVPATGFPTPTQSSRERSGQTDRPVRGHD
jgi:hypothetical protein